MRPARARLPDLVLLRPASARGRLGDAVLPAAAVPARPAGGPTTWVPLLALRTLLPVLNDSLGAQLTDDVGGPGPPAPTARVIAPSVYEQARRALSLAGELATGEPVQIPVNQSGDQMQQLEDKAIEIDEQLRERPPSTPRIDPERAESMLEAALATAALADALEGPADAYGELRLRDRFPAHALRFSAAVGALTYLFAVPRLTHRCTRLRRDPRPFDELNALDLREALGARFLVDAPASAAADRRRAMARIEGLRATHPSLFCDTEALGSALVRVLYDLAFAYEEGDRGRPNVAAGVGVENVINILLLHGGNVMHKMRAGMGDAIFAPLYRALRNPSRRGARPVSFEFFSAVEGIQVDRNRVTAIEVRRQTGSNREWSAAYEPLDEPRGDPGTGIWTWPNKPRRSQFDEEHWGRLVSGLAAEDSRVNAFTALERTTNPLRHKPGEHLDTLTRGKDFDDVVLAIPPAALAGLKPAPDGRDLLACSPLLQATVDGAHPVATQALQLWFDRPSGATGPGVRGGVKPLGWPTPETSLHPVVGGYSTRFDGSLLASEEEMFDTYCDMSHVLEREWGWDPKPLHLGYFCRVTALEEAELRDLDPDQPNATLGRLADDRARTTGLGFLRAHVALPHDRRPFWAEALDPKALSDPRDKPGTTWESRFDAQYWRCNSGRSERYSTSRAGTVNRRPRPGDLRSRRAGRSRVANLALAGDWTYTAVNAGSVEAAVLSGIEAARAIAGPLARRPQLPWWRRPAYTWGFGRRA